VLTTVGGSPSHRIAMPCKKGDERGHAGVNVESEEEQCVAQYCTVLSDLLPVALSC
jgi:hypothetical protein